MNGFSEVMVTAFGDAGKAPRVAAGAGSLPRGWPVEVDAIVEVTETGSSLRANKLRIVDTLLESYPQLIASRAAMAAESVQPGAPLPSRKLSGRTKRMALSPAFSPLGLRPRNAPFAVSTTQKA